MSIAFAYGGRSAGFSGECLVGLAGEEVVLYAYAYAPCKGCVERRLLLLLLSRLWECVADGKPSR